MGAGAIFVGTTIKLLKSILDFNGGIQILSSSVDPTSSATSAPKGSALFNTSNGNLYIKQDAGSSTNWTLVAGPSTVVPTLQVLTSGSGTYTTPANTKWIKIRMVGGGGGGGGSSTAANSTAGGTGGTTTFGSSLLTCTGGVGGSGNSNATAAGGTATGGYYNVTGASGGQANDNSGGFGGPGQPGGCSPFGGAGLGGYGTIGTGTLGITNTGSGGGGGYIATSACTGGGGGAAGGYLEAIIGAPSATYVYGIGASGTLGAAGTLGKAGSAGGSGVIIVEEHYNA